MLCKSYSFPIARIASLFVMNNKKVLSQLCVLNDCWDIIVPLIRSTGTIMSHNKTNRKMLFFHRHFLNKRSNGYYTTKNKK